jgi:hypothetical protein
VLYLADFVAVGGRFSWDVDKDMVTGRALVAADADGLLAQLRDHLAASPHGVAPEKPDLYQRILSAIEEEDGDFFVSDELKDEIERLVEHVEGAKDAHAG